MQNTNDIPSTVEGTHGPRASAASLQPGDGRISLTYRQVTDWQMPPEAAQEENDRPLIDLVVAARYGERPALWPRKPKVAIAWAAVANRLWTIPAFNGKYRQYPVQNGGGFGIQASGQAVALGLGSILFTATGDDAKGATLRQELAGTGVDMAGVRVMSGLTTSAEVVVCNGQRAVLIDQGAPGAEWRPNAGDRALMNSTDAVWFGGTLSDAVVEELCESARQLGKPVFANPTRLERPETLNLEGVRICQISRDDVPNFGFAPDAPAAAVAELFLKRGCSIVVVTESERGERAFDQGGNSVWKPGVPGRKALYPTGAGDVALAAHAAGYLGGLRMCDWVNLGTLAGAFFVEHGYPGTWADLAVLGREWPPERRVADIA